MNLRWDVDLSNQINNSWNKDSVIVARKDNVNFSVKIKTENKKKLRKLFIRDDGTKSGKMHDNKIVCLIYCCMLHKLIEISNGKIDKVLICRDIKPAPEVTKYISKICSYLKEEPLTNRVSIKFRKSNDSKSKAHHTANKIMKGRRNANYTFKDEDIAELEEMIRKVL